MKKNIVLLTILVFFILLSGYESLKEDDQVGFKNPIITNGADESLVQKIESAVIIPGGKHEKLWVHPEVVTIPGTPIVCELRVRTTDRRGRDHHTDWHYFQTDDYFQSFRSIEKPSAEAWNRTRITPENIDTTLNSDIYPALPPDLSWNWYMSYIHLDSKTILQPFYTSEGQCRSVQTMVARIEEDGIVPLYISNALTNHHQRGFLEPHLAQYGGRCFMTVRAEDKRGYIMSSDNSGRTWNTPVPWKWENGDEIPMHTTMTKLLSHSEGLALVYTRIQDNNNVFRNRAPLYIADINEETLRLKRSTERIFVPDRGLPLGNFWVWPVNQHESYVVTAEWPRDGRKNNGDVWLAKVKWKKTNQQMTEDGTRRSAFK